ncbi:hypothetical protein COX85_03280 [Candidatus Micrarchaeota archaeon CG_4_10_14_0_2_um_filter_55_9]|nr:MAG: hypothetical protein AUJ15_03525 [Candidatus Micrarchaeota archaeon CG1_02_55_41]PIO03673.1 MAG: hypothetical protein COT57_00410 [Candidatus Micrarchaeota archaeon CG09_land_8_20_14_0_10_55_25]PIZ91548.1 MAG: hypothetical protein COX85_03280 [Candidatus Micrarchaeota archaeon CG_4_10_14_0_2_um_filter_55_9]PJD01407.1 MAG: hypothetical protein COU38_01175 [Candidatus Micrarchaeota archaeon CG10_big_fil_rev_8_21_14_0_10_54_18]
MFNKNILITRPAYDDATAYLYAYSEQFPDMAREHGLNPIDLKNERATKKEFESVIKKQKPVCLILNGHGDDGMVVGQKNEVLVSLGDNHQLLDGTIVYARACRAAAGLGAKTVGIIKAPKTFIGYVHDFLFFLNNTQTATPLRDDYAAPCLNASNAIPEALLKGHTAAEAVHKSEEHTKKEIQYLLTHYSPAASHILFALRWNKAVMQLYGDKTAHL